MSSDLFARQVIFLHEDGSWPAVSAGDLIAIRTAGAYGFVLSSNYNSRPRACEAVIDGSPIHIARQRETWSDLIRGENLLPPS